MRTKPGLNSAHDVACGRAAFRGGAWLRECSLLKPGRFSGAADAEFIVEQMVTARRKGIVRAGQYIVAWPQREPATPTSMAPPSRTQLLVPSTRT